LDRLRERFAGRGVAVSSGVIGGVLASHAVQAAPVALTSGIVQSALLVTTASAAPAALGSGAGQALGFLAMTKSQTGALVAIVLGFAIPLGVQRSELNSVLSNLTSAHAAPAAEPPTVFEPNAALKESETEEISRLRRQADELRVKIAAKRTEFASRKLASAKPVAGPTLVQIGRAVALSELSFAGNETPEAALQSLVAFRRVGDVDGATSLMLFSPKMAEELSEALASPEFRERFAQEMVETTQGVIMESSVRIHPDQTQEHREAKRFPEGPAAATVEILKKTKIDERRVQFSLRFIRGHDTRIESAIFGLTSSGWKEIP